MAWASPLIDNPGWAVRVWLMKILLIGRIVLGKNRNGPYDRVLCGLLVSATWSCSSQIVVFAIAGIVLSQISQEKARLACNRA